jgi:fructose-1,6-bisphosphatase/inositol monophosphatase family enzyme
MHHTVHESSTKLAILLLAGIRGAKIILELQKKAVQGQELISWEKGTDREIATAADKASEQQILDTLKQYLGDFNFLSEETEGIQLNNPSDDEIIVIDSLDGTIDFLSMGSNFGITLGLLNRHSGEVVANLMIFPATQEVMIAHKDSEKIHYSKSALSLDSLDDAKTFLTKPDILLTFPSFKERTNFKQSIIYSAHKKSPYDVETLNWYLPYLAELGKKGIPAQTIDASCAGIKNMILKFAWRTSDAAATYTGTKFWDASNTWLLTKKAGCLMFNAKTGEMITSETFKQQICNGLSQPGKNSDIYPLPVGASSSETLRLQHLQAYQAAQQLQTSTTSTPSATENQPKPGMF